MCCIISVPGDHDSELKWPFRLRHTITLAGWHYYDIKMTIDPAKLDEEFIEYCFGNPNVCRAAWSSMVLE